MTLLSALLLTACAPGQSGRKEINVTSESLYVQKVENMLKSGDATLQNHIRDITANINSCL
jgi:hypothetical protein